MRLFKVVGGSLDRLEQLRRGPKLCVAEHGDAVRGMPPLGQVVAKSMRSYAVLPTGSWSNNSP